MLYQPPFVPGAVPAVPGTHNADANAGYINGDPLIAQEGSYIPCEAVEHVQRELIGSLTSSGITPALASLDQVAEAMGRYASGAINCYVSAQVGNAYTVLPSVGTFVVPKALFAGMEAQFFVATPNTGAATLNAFSLGVKPLVSEIDAALPKGALRGFARCVYDPAKQGGTGAWVLLPAYFAVGSLPRNVFIATASGNYVKPANLVGIKVRMIGGGGGGGVSGGGFLGGNGGSGAYIEAFYDTTDLAASEPFLIGGGGIGKNGSSFGSGTAGGATTFKTLSAGGGQPGVGAASALGASGNGGVASAGGWARATPIAGVVGFFASYAIPSYHLLAFYGAGGAGSTTGFNAVNGNNSVIIIEEYTQ